MRSPTTVLVLVSRETALLASRSFFFTMDFALWSDLASPFKRSDNTVSDVLSSIASEAASSVTFDLSMKRSSSLSA